MATPTLMTLPVLPDQKKGKVDEKTAAVKKDGDVGSAGAILATIFTGIVVLFAGFLKNFHGGGES